MKKHDVVRYENRHFVILEILPNGYYGCRCLNDGEKHTLKPNEVVMVQSYPSLTIPLKVRLKNAYRWFFSNKFDTVLKKYFFKIAKLFFVFCCALAVALPFILLL